MNSTITAIATSHGVGAISIVRLSGSRSLEIASKVTGREEGWFTERYMKLTNFYTPSGEVIDRGMVVYFRGPASFTGEDIVEFQTHGGVMIAKILLKTLLQYGAEPASGGEFTKRAFLNGKIDLTEAEAIGELINARSEEATFQLSRQLNGELKNFVDEVRSSLVNILAYSEVSIDYADEDLPETVLDSIREKLQNIEKQLQRVVEGSRSRTAIFEGFKIAIVGRPNVGKSSLLNRLLNYERAIVSSIEGTTRDSVEELLTVGTHLVKVVDTAGIREANDTIEQIGIERSLQAMDSADAVLALFDSSTELTEEDFRVLNMLKGSDKRIFILLNKSDLPSVIDKSQFNGFQTISISTKSSSGEVVSILSNYLDSVNSTSDGGIVLSTVRQISSVEKSMESIRESREPLDSGELELFSFHLNEAIDSITAISRPYQYSEMLDEMFGNFCLGK